MRNYKFISVYLGKIFKLLIFIFNYTKFHGYIFDWTIIFKFIIN